MWLTNPPLAHSGSATVYFRELNNKVVPGWKICPRCSKEVSESVEMIIDSDNQLNKSEICDEDYPKVCLDKLNPSLCLVIELFLR